MPFRSKGQVLKEPDLPSQFDAVLYVRNGSGHAHYIIRATKGDASSIAQFKEYFTGKLGLPSIVECADIDRGSIWGPVPKLVADHLVKSGVNDVHEMKFVMVADDIQHVLDQHGNRLREQARGQVAVTPSDFELLPTILNNPDSVRLSDPTPDGLTVLVFEKLIGNRYVVVQTVRQGRKSIALKTMWVHKV